MQDAWNSERLRKGDQIGVVAGNPNQWTMKGLLRLAFSSVGFAAGPIARARLSDISVPAPSGTLSLCGMPLAAGL